MRSVTSSEEGNINVVGAGGAVLLEGPALQVPASPRRAQGGGLRAARRRGQSVPLRVIWRAGGEGQKDVFVRASLAAGKPSTVDPPHPSSPTRARP